MTITAKYEDGVFKPLEDVTLNEGTIVEVCVPSYASHLKGKSRSVRDFGFYGMWKDRTDIGDSVEYISKLRRDLREGHANTSMRCRKDGRFRRSLPGYRWRTG